MIRFAAGLATRRSCLLPTSTEPFQYCSASCPELPLEMKIALKPRSAASLCFSRFSSRFACYQLLLIMKFQLQVTRFKHHLLPSYSLFTDYSLARLCHQNSSHLFLLFLCGLSPQLPIFPSPQRPFLQDNEPVLLPPTSWPRPPPPSSFSLPPPGASSLPPACASPFHVSPASLARFALFRQPVFGRFLLAPVGRESATQASQPSTQQRQQLATSLPS